MLPVEIEADPGVATKVDELQRGLDDLNSRTYRINVEVEFPATGPLMTHAGVTLVAPALLSLIACEQQTGLPVLSCVVSSYRTYEQQQALYEAYLNGSGNLAAAPGSSNHETGTAVDISPLYSGVRAWMVAHGWVWDVPSEPWHAHWIGVS